jgi:hypothetical protein
MPDAVWLTQARQALTQGWPGGGGGRGEVSLGNIAARVVCPTPCGSHKHSKHWYKMGAGRGGGRQGRGG